MSYHVGQVEFDENGKGRIADLKESHDGIYVSCAAPPEPPYYTLTVDADVRAIMIYGMTVPRASYDSAANRSTFLISKEMATEHGFTDCLPATDFTLLQ